MDGHHPQYQENRRQVLDAFLQQTLRLTHTGLSDNKPVYHPEVYDFLGLRPFTTIQRQSLENVRGSLWWIFSGAAELAMESEVKYEQVVAVESKEEWVVLGGSPEAYEAAEASHRDILLDIRRTDATMTTPESESIIRILSAFALVNPKIGYCQAMNFITLCLLRVCGREDQTFYILNCLSWHILPYYFIKSMKGVRADMLVTYNLFKRHLPALLTHFESLGLPLELFVTEWLLCIFSNDFPKPTVFRLWDWFFLEGPSVTFFVLLAFFRTIQSGILQCRDMEHCINYIKSQASSLMDVQELIDLAVKERDMLGSNEVTELREMSLDQVKWCYSTVIWSFCYS